MYTALQVCCVSVQLIGCTHTQAEDEVCTLGAHFTILGNVEPSLGEVYLFIYALKHLSSEQSKIIFLFHSIVLTAFYPH